MRNRLASTLASVSLFLGAAPVHAQGGGPKSFEVSSTQRLAVPPGATIHIDGSYGYLSVDGWDAPEVEMVVVKSTDRFFKPGQQDEAKSRLEQIRVTTQVNSESDLTIQTVCPSREGSWAPPLKSTKKNGVTVDYRIHVPATSRLVVHHDNGYVWVSGITRDIEINSHTGDMIVMLPDGGAYAIDAHTKLGSVSSDFDGKTLSHFLLGTHFADSNSTPRQKVVLRMDRGSITIKKDTKD